MLAPVRMIVTYPLYMAMERAIFHSQTFEKTWSGLRPKLEKGVEPVSYTHLTLPTNSRV